MNKKLSVEIDNLVLCLSHFEGGMELDAIKLCENLTSYNEKTILVCKENTFISNRAEEKGVNYKEVNFKRKLSLKLILELRAILIKHRVKNLIFFGASELKSIYFSLIGLNEVNLIVRYGTTRNTSKKNFVHKLFYSRVNHHVAISKHLKKNIIDVIPIDPRATLPVIYTATKFSDPSKIKGKDKYKALHIGRIAKGKGQLEAIKIIKNTTLKIDLIGPASDSYYLDNINKFVGENNMGNQVNFLGYQPNPQIHMQAASFFIFPSEGEGLPNALIEALGNGLICFTLDNTVFPEFIELGFHLYVCKSVEEIHCHLQSAIDNYDVEIKLAEKNILLAREFFSVEREIAGFKKILN